MQNIGTRFTSTLVCVFAFCAFAISNVSPVHATTVTANSVADLIADLDAAQSSNATIASPYIINLSPNTTYILTAADNSTEYGNNGLPIIMAPVEINGNGASIERSSADGTPDFRILQAFSALTLNDITLSNGSGPAQGNNVVTTVYSNGGGIEFYTTGTSTLTLTNCSITNCTSAAGGAISNDAQGAMILSDCDIADNSSGSGGGICASSGSPGPMTLTDCALVANTISGSDGTGGAIEAGGQLTMTGCTVSGNSAESSNAAGLYTGFFPVTITNCSFTNNTTTGGVAGAIDNNATPMTIMGCTISGNEIDNSAVGYAYGAGIFNDGTVNVTNCTIANNTVLSTSQTSAFGAALNNVGTATLIDCTISGNMQNSGTGAIANMNSYGGDQASPTTITDCILYGDTGGEIDAGNGAVTTVSYSDVQGGIPAGATDNGHNISGDPVLGALADNGGTTETMAITAGSPAIGAGISSGAPSNDQRGAARPNPPAIGAYQPVTLPAAPTPSVSPNGGTFTSIQTVTITDTLSGALIYYTIDGSTPTQESTLYTGQFTVSAGETVNAIAIDSAHAPSPQTSAIFVINIPVASFTAGLYMISLPYSYPSTTLADLFGYSSPVLAVWTPLSASYAITPKAPADSIVLGQGYWVRFPQAVAITQTGTPATPSTPFDIQLGAGWNMIGDPWTASVPLSACTFSNGTITYAQATSEPNLLIGNAFSYSNSTNTYSLIYTIAPDQGYWLYVYSATDMEVPPPAD